MKSSKFALIVIALLSFGSSLYSQIGMSIKSDRKIYLQYEPIYIKVSLRNYSGKTLVFGESDNTKGNLSFNVVTPAKGIAPRSNSTFNPMLGEIIPTGGTAEILVPINRIYNMGNTGEYNITGIVIHEMLPSSYKSPPLSIIINSGKICWEKLVGVPDLFKKKEYTDPARTYKIISFYDGTGTAYSLVVEDKDRVYGVARIGYDIGGNPPECEIDGLSRIHILVPVTPSMYSYFCYDINCSLERNEAYLKTNTSPTLVLDPKEGMVIVAGGKKAVKDVDYVEKDGIPVFKENR